MDDPQAVQLPAPSGPYVWQTYKHDDSANVWVNLGTVETNSLAGSDPKMAQKLGALGGAGEYVLVSAEGDSGSARRYWVVASTVYTLGANG